MATKKEIAAVRAEANRLGGRLALSNGYPVVHIAHRGLEGEVVDTYLSLAQAQELDEFPPTTNKPTNAIWKRGMVKYEMSFYEFQEELIERYHDVRQDGYTWTDALQDVIDREKLPVTAPQEE